MFKQFALALAALGLAVSAPAYADARVDLRIGTPLKHEYRPYRGPDRYPHDYRNYRTFKQIPRCNRWEVAIRDPYRYNRWYCVDRRYRDYRQGY